MTEGESRRFWIPANLACAGPSLSWLQAHLNSRSMRFRVYRLINTPAAAGCLRAGTATTRHPARQARPSVASQRAIHREASSAFQ